MICLGGLFVSGLGWSLIVSVLGWVVYVWDGFGVWVGLFCLWVGWFGLFVGVCFGLLVSLLGLVLLGMVWV